MLTGQLESQGVNGIHVILGAQHKILFLSLSPLNIGFNFVKFVFGYCTLYIQSYKLQRCKCCVSFLCSILFIPFKEMAFIWKVIIGVFVFMMADGVMTVEWSTSSEWVLVTGGCDGAIRFWDIRRAGCFLVLDQSHSQLGRRPPILQRSATIKVFFFSFLRQKLYF